MLIHLPDRTVDLDRRTVDGPAGASTLTTKEAALLRYLAERAGMVVERDTLLLEVWGHRVRTETRAVDQTMRRLRQKLEIDPGEPVYLITETGQGYKWIPPGLPATAGDPGAARGPNPSPSVRVRIQALLGRGMPFVVAGPPGVGKTRTIEGALAGRSTVRIDASTPPPALADGQVGVMVRAQAVGGRGRAPASGPWIVETRDPRPWIGLEIVKLEPESLEAVRERLSTVLPDAPATDLEAMVDASQGIPWVLEWIEAQAKAAGSAAVFRELEAGLPVPYDLGLDELSAEHRARTLELAAFTGWFTKEGAAAVWNVPLSTAETILGAMSVHGFWRVEGDGRRMRLWNTARWAALDRGRDVVTESCHRLAIWIAQITPKDFDLASDLWHVAATLVDDHPREAGLALSAHWSHMNPAVEALCAPWIPRLERALPPEERSRWGLRRVWTLVDRREIDAAEQLLAELDVSPEARAIGSAAIAMQRHDEARTLAVLGSVAEDIADPDLRLRRACVLMVLAMRRTEFDRAEVLLEGIIADARSVRDRYLEGIGYLGQAMVFGQQDRPGAARAAAEQAKAIADTLPWTLLWGNARNVLGRICQAQGDPVGAERLQREAMAHGAMGEAGSMLAQLDLISILIEQERSDDAEYECQQMRKTLDRIGGDTRLSLGLAPYEIELALLQGRKSAAQRMLKTYGAHPALEQEPRLQQLFACLEVVAGLRRVEDLPRSTDPSWALAIEVVARWDDPSVSARARKEGGINARILALLVERVMRSA